MLNLNDFCNLNFHSQLNFVTEFGIEFDKFMPSFGNLNVIFLYRFNDFLIDLELDLITKEYTSINAFKSLSYLEKYPIYFEKMKREVYEILDQ